MVKRTARWTCKLTLLALACASPGLAPGLAKAQSVGAAPSILIAPELDREDAAGARIEPGYVAKPVTIGSIVVQPRLSAVATYESNVFNRPVASSAAVAVLMPSLTVGTDLPRHEAKVIAAGTIRRFSRYAAENSEEFGLTARGRLDMGATDAVVAAIDYSHLIEARSSVGTVANAEEPVAYGRWSADLEARFRFGRLGVTPSLGYEAVAYDALAISGGDSLDLSFRDTRSLSGNLRLAYDVSGLVAVFASGRYAEITSPSASSDQRRDSRNLALVTGIKGALSPVLSAEAAAGYQLRDYALDGYLDFSGPTFQADMQWFVTPLLTLRGQASRVFRNSGNRQVAAILADTLTLTAFYDPLRNLRLAITAALERGDFREVDARSWRKSVQIKGHYLLNRHIAVGAYLSYLRQDVTGPPIVSPFSSVAAGIGITVTP